MLTIVVCHCRTFNYIKVPIFLFKKKSNFYQNISLTWHHCERRSTGGFRRLHQPVFIYTRVSQVLCHSRWAVVTHIRWCVGRLIFIFGRADTVWLETKEAVPDFPYDIFAREISDGQRHLVSFDQTLQKGLSYLSWRHVIFRLLVNERKNISFVTVTGVVESLGIFVFSSPSNALWFLFFFSPLSVRMFIFIFHLFLLFQSACKSRFPVHGVFPFFFISSVFFFFLAKEPGRRRCIH